jgi:hypothetical protein
MSKVNRRLIGRAKICPRKQISERLLQNRENLEAKRSEITACFHTMCQQDSTKPTQYSTYEAIQHEGKCLDPIIGQRGILKFSAPKAPASLLDRMS